MKLRLLTAAVALFAFAGLSFAQIKVSKKEGEAYKAVLDAQTPDDQIAAVDKFVTSFSDSKLKSQVLFIAANAAERKGDIPKAIAYASDAIDADPKNYQAMILVAGELARGTRENDLDKEEKLTKADKLANDALNTIKDAPKPNAQLTDEQWDGYKKDFAGQAHEDLGMIAGARKKYDDAIAQLKLATETPTPNPGTFIRLATVYDEAHKPDEALAVLAKVMAMPNLDPTIKRFAEREQAVAQKLKAAAK